MTVIRVSIPYFYYINIFSIINMYYFFIMHVKKLTGGQKRVELKPIGSLLNSSFQLR